MDPLMLALRLPERRSRLGLHRASGADDADPVSARARRPAELVAQAQAPLSGQADVLPVRRELRAGLADDGEGRGPGEEDDGLLVGGHV